MAKKYVCIQPCILGGKRYEEGELLNDGISPNQFFKDAETGEIVPAPHVDIQPESIAVPVAEQENQSALLPEILKDVSALVEELETVKAGVGAELDELKAAIIELSNKFDLMEAHIKSSTDGNETTNESSDLDTPSKPTKGSK